MQSHVTMPCGDCRTTRAISFLSFVLLFTWERTLWHQHQQIAHNVIAEGAMECTMVWLVWVKVWPTQLFLAEPRFLGGVAKWAAGQASRE